MQSPYRIDDQVAVVTGGANGLGEGIGLALARQGAHVVIADVDAENAERVATAVRALGRQALCVTTDVTDTAQVRRAVAAAKETFGRLDVMVNNAGGTRHGPFLKQSERSWRRHIDLNLVSMLCGTQEAAQVMIEGGRGGTIINVASIEASRAAPNFAVYAACKAGMVSFTKTMALELAEHRIRVHALAPDIVETPGIAKFWVGTSEATHKARDGYIPLGRMGRMDELGNVAAFLASDMASYLNGITVPVDGGTAASAGWAREPGSGEWVLYHP